MPAKLTANDLNGFVGKSIAEICDKGYHPDSENHCAHFVSHALGIQIGTLCGDMAYATRHSGATLRVNELYNGPTLRGAWAERLSTAAMALIFVTDADRNMNGRFMGQNPQKHVGIWSMGSIWNYSNGHHAVVRDISVEMFHAKFKRTYHGKNISLYYGMIP